MTTLRDHSSSLHAKLVLLLENKGSTARDHLANERTFLAWLRTSLAFASLGIAITQLFRLSSPIVADPRIKRTAKPLGATFIVVAAIVLFLGVRRYFHSQNLLTQGKFPASKGSVAITSFLTIMLIIAFFVILVTLSY